MPLSHTRVLDASKANNFGNGDDVEDEGPVLEVALVLNRRVEEKIEAIFGT